MGWLTPYVINGARHTAALFRRQAQRPATDQAGVARPGDLKVTQLPAAGPGFRIAQGGLSLPSRFPGRGRESYGVENADAVIDVLDVPGTGSAKRSDAVVVEVLDPNYLSITPAEAEAENYMRVHVVQSVPATATSIEQVPGFSNRTAYMLARIDWPANQTAIQGSYIKDMRQLALPMRDVHTRNYELTSGDGSQAITSTLTYPQGQTWPSQIDSAWSKIRIPDWATHVRIVLTWNGVLVPGGAATGYVWCQVGENTNPNRVVTQARLWQTTREGYRVSGTVRLDDALRGTEQWFFPRATRLTGSNATAPVLDANSGLDLLVEFYQTAI